MRGKDCFILKGNLIYAKEDRTLAEQPGGFVVCEDGICAGVFDAVPERYQNFPVTDYKDALIMPGMTDLHVHAPQYTFRGLGMDLELLDWLSAHTFPEEARYAELSYAKQAYPYFVNELRESYTTRACVFATLHGAATVELMDELEESGLVTYVGKVNMDRNGGENLCEESAAAGAAAARDWLSAVKGRYARTTPILTPRFTPCCTDELMRLLAELQRETGLRVQSHLSENPSEIAWVKELVPQASCYADAYALFGMLGSRKTPAVMAHCVYSDDAELALLKEHGTYIAHCPESNLNVSSGIAPVGKFLAEGLFVGLGSDVAGGSTLSMLRAVTLAVQVSKMYWRLVDNTVRPLTFADAFYLATLGGGRYFGKVGSFLPGYEFDALAVDDSGVKSVRRLTVTERAERMAYQECACRLVGKYVRGRKLM